MNVQKIAFEVIIIHSSSYAGCFHGIQRPFNAVNVITNVLNQTRPLFKLNLPIKKANQTRAERAFLLWKAIICYCVRVQVALLYGFSVKNQVSILAIFHRHHFDYLHFL